MCIIVEGSGFFDFGNGENYEMYLVLITGVIRNIIFYNPGI